MKKAFVVALFALSIVFYTGCTNVPGTPEVNGDPSDKVESAETPEAKSNGEAFQSTVNVVPPVAPSPTAQP